MSCCGCRVVISAPVPLDWHSRHETSTLKVRIEEARGTYCAAMSMVTSVFLWCLCQAIRRAVSQELTGQESHRKYGNIGEVSKRAICVFVLLFGHDIFCLSLALVLTIISVEDYHMRVILELFTIQAI